MNLSGSPVRTDAQTRQISHNCNRPIQSTQLTSERHAEELKVLLERQGVVVAVENHAYPLAHLVLGRIVQQRIVALRVAVVQQMIVDQIPAPALLVGAQQRYVAVALQRRRFGCDTDDSHRAERSLPDHLPRVAAVPEADLGARGVRTLGDRASVCDGVRRIGLIMFYQ